MTSLHDLRGERAGGNKMTEPTIRENRIKKMTQASVKFLALKAGFEKKAREARADFEEANRIWNETAKNIKGWDSLP